jgi:hypothetical protein
MAQASVWINVVSILATFDIMKAIGEDGHVIEPTYEYFSALVSCVKLLRFVNVLIFALTSSMPLPFECSIKPRSQRSVDLIRATINDEEHI